MDFTLTVDAFSLRSAHATSYSFELIILSMKQDPKFYLLKEDDSPSIFGPVEKQRWSYACAKQMIERLIFGTEINCSICVLFFFPFVLHFTPSFTLHLRIDAAEGAEHGLEFTIVRPFNWIGPRMDFIPGVDGPNDAVPRVLACFSNVI